MAYTYCTASSIFEIMPLLPVTGSAGYTTTMLTTIQTHERRAAGIIDSYCGKRYDLPFNPPPPVIRAIAEDLTVYYVYRSFFTQDNHNKLEYFEDLVKLAREDLEKIRDGQMDLFSTAGSEITTSTEDEQSLLDSTTKDYQSFFDIDEPTDWTFDNDLADDLSDKR